MGEIWYDSQVVWEKNCKTTKEGLLVIHFDVEYNKETNRNVAIYPSFSISINL